MGQKDFCSYCSIFIESFAILSGKHLDVYRLQMYMLISPHSCAFYSGAHTVETHSAQCIFMFCLFDVMLYVNSYGDVWTISSPNHTLFLDNLD